MRIFVIDNTKLESFVEVRLIQRMLIISLPFTEDQACRD